MWNLTFFCSFFLFRGEGDDSKAFRSAYGQLAELKSFLKRKVPIIALTATATKEMRDHIFENLQLDKPFFSVSIPMKQNIKYLKLDFCSANVEDIFKNLLSDFQLNGFNANKVIVFCRTMNEFRPLFRYFDKQLERLYPDSLNCPYARYH